MLSHEDVKGSGGIPPPFLTSALDRGEWSVSRPGRLTQGEMGAGTSLVCSWNPTIFIYHHFYLFSLFREIQEVLVRTNCLLSFDTTWTSWKVTHPRILHCRGNVFTEPLPSNDRGIHIQTYRHRLMGGIYKESGWDGLRCHNICIRFHKDWFPHSNVDRENIHTQTARWSHKPTKNKDSRPKIKLGLWHSLAMCVSPHSINFWMPEPIFMKLDTYITASEPITTTYFKNPSHKTACLCVYAPYRC
jgi:hypothetical protein